MAFLDENGVAQFWATVKDRLAGAFDSVEFNVAERAANLVSGDSIATAFGKLAKNYTSILTSISDLNTSLENRISELNTSLTNQINTKLNKSDVLANYTTTATGKALDASLGPAIKSKMNLADTLNTKVGALESRYISTSSSINTLVDAILALPDDSPRFVLVGLMDDASKYITGTNTPCYGIGFRADNVTVDLFFGAYSLSSVYICRIRKSNNDYTIAGLKRVVLANVS